MKNWHHNIEAYLLGELTEPEKMAFEQALQQDPELAQATEAHREVLQRLEALRLRRVVQAALAPRPPARSWWWVWLLLATGIGSMVFMFFPKPIKPDFPPPTESAPIEPIAQKTPDTLAPPTRPEQPVVLSIRQWASLVKKHQVKPNAATLRSDQVVTPSEKTAFTRAQEAYHAGRFAEALQLLEQAPDDEDVRYYRANTLFQLQRFTEAGKVFKALETSFQYGQEARWNGFLCRAGSGQLQRAQVRNEALKLAADPSFEYRTFAAQLARELSQ
ncbi:MAG TPA: tetratricopeptide repeat protein [Saprospiraceae bacterium]|nr:tetratricopeptide repeat protein [Saprospiraceae bacterium]